MLFQYIYLYFDLVLLKEKQTYKEKKWFDLSHIVNFVFL
jgi:hypothetical protein